MCFRTMYRSIHFQVTNCSTVCVTWCINNFPRYLDYFVERIKMLLYYNVVPVVVFDGARLPMKSETEAMRRESREMYLEKGKALVKEKKWSHAVECFQRAVSITPVMAHRVAEVSISIFHSSCGLYDCFLGVGRNGSRCDSCSL